MVFTGLVVRTPPPRKEPTMSAIEEYATYVWTDPGQFGAWLTSEERYALLDIF